MKLYLLRHGPAGQRNEWTGDDFLRPLTDEGKQRMAHEAAALVKLDLGLDLIITSPLVRAYQTAEIVAKHLSLPDKLVKDDRLAPGFGLKELAQILQAHAAADALMLVGHEPDLSEMTSQLIGGGQVEFKKGSLACVDVPDIFTLKGELVWLLTPRLLTFQVAASRDYDSTTPRR